jgi:hypothetical protein
LWVILPRALRCASRGSNIAWPSAEARWSSGYPACSRHWTCLVESKAGILAIARSQLDLAAQTLRERGHEVNEP